MNINFDIIIVVQVNLPRSAVVICTITIDEFDSAFESPVYEQIITVPFRSAVALAQDRTDENVSSVLVVDMLNVFISTTNGSIKMA